ncbi:MAG: amylo-alpha-1,6-glucosidase [archaeon]
MEKKSEGICHVISKEGNFVFRFNSGGFGSKWMGFWKGERKVLEYWAFNFGKSWLSPENFSGFKENLSERRARLSFGGDLAEEVCFSKDGLRVAAASKIPETCEIELGINLREAGENSTGSPGNVVSFGGGVLTVEGRGGRREKISGLDGFELTENFQKRHYPGRISEKLGWKYFNEAEQDCLVVRLKSARKTKAAGFSVASCGFPPEEPAGSPEAFDEIHRFPDSELGEFVGKCAQLSTSFLSGEKYLAGFPYFAKFWARDACISLPALSRLGLYARARKVLEKIGESQRLDGAIPNFPGSDDFSSADTTPLFILAVADYWNWSGEKVLVEEVAKAADFFWKTDVDGDGLSETDARSVYDTPLKHWTTWMDSIERSGKAVEVNFLWADALVKAGKLLGEEGFEEKGQKLSSSCEEKFWKSEWAYFADTIGGPTYNQKSSNILFPLAIGRRIPDDRAVAALRTIESEEFTKPWGVQTGSAKNPNYSPNGYHTGAVWNLLTGLASLAEFKYGRPEKGLEYLGILKSNFGRRCAQALDETFDGSGAPQGAVSQAWSASIVPRIVDDGLFGIEPDAEAGRVGIRPKIPEGFGRIERIGKIAGKKFEISVLNGGKISVNGRNCGGEFSL